MYFEFFLGSQLLDPIGDVSEGELRIEGVGPVLILLQEVLEVAGLRTRCTGGRNIYHYDRYDNVHIQSEARQYIHSYIAHYTSWPLPLNLSLGNSFSR